MKRIALTQGKYALVDDTDYKWLRQWEWHYEKGYAARTRVNRDAPGPKNIYMHRTILKLKSKVFRKIQVDHIDGNGLNNQRSNLRVVNTSKNAMNRKKMSGCKSKYKGVTKRPAKYKKKQWQASIRVNGKLLYLGDYITQEQAALAYNDAALKHFGNFARINKVKDETEKDNAK